MELLKDIVNKFDSDSKSKKILDYISNINIVNNDETSNYAPIYIQLTIDKISDVLYSSFDKDIILSHAEKEGKQYLLSEGLFDKSDISLSYSFKPTCVYYANGEYHVLLSDLREGFFNAFIPHVLKDIVKQNPTAQIPSFLCHVINYPFKENDVDLELINQVQKEMNLYFTALNFSEDQYGFKQLQGYVSQGHIFIDLDNNSIGVIKGMCRDKDNVPINWELEYKDRNNLEKLLEEFHYVNDINSITHKETIKIIINDEKDFKFIHDGKIIDFSELIQIHTYVIDDAKKKYLELVETIKNKSEKFFNLLTSYNEIWNKINSRYEFLDNYLKKIETLKGRLTFRKKIDNYNNENKVTESVKVDIYDLNSIKENIFKLPLDFIVEDVTNIEATSFRKKFLKMNSVNNYFDNIINIMENNILVSNGQLESIEEECIKVQNQTYIKAIQNPVKVQLPSLKTEISDIYVKEENEEKHSDFHGYDFVKLQEEQSHILSEEEKMALMIYKTQLYYSINKIVIYVRNNSSIDSEQIDNFIKAGYANIKAAYKTPLEPDHHIKSRFDEVIKPGVLPSYEEYKDIVYKYIPIVEKALKKVRLDQDLTVYRFAYSNDYNDLGNSFLSTSISIDEALKFSDARPGFGKPILYKINLQKNSPMTAFVSEIIYGKISTVNPFADAQKEILLDAINYDFNITEVRKCSDIEIANKKISELYIVEVTATPKMFMEQTTMIDEQIEKKSQHIR